MVAVIGPSACGKSSVVRELHRRRLIRVNPTWTTRPRRPDEAAGSLEHRFVSAVAFAAMDDTGFFLDTARLPGLPHRYGLPHLAMPRPGRIDVVVMRAALVTGLASVLPGLVVYQIADDMERARLRLVGRGCSDEEVVVRLADHDREVRRGRPHAHRVFSNNGHLIDLVDEVAAALQADFVVPGAFSDLAVAS